MVLITDRTQSDVDSGTDKGYYNATDLNRVGAAVAYIAERFNSMGYIVEVSPRTDWQESDLPTESDMVAYLADVSVLRAVIAVMQSTPEVPENMKFLDYVRANDIEKILLDIDTLITNIQKSWYFSGEVYAGEV